MPDEFKLVASLSDNVSGPLKEILKATEALTGKTSHMTGQFDKLKDSVGVIGRNLKEALNPALASFGLTSGTVAGSVYGMVRAFDTFAERVHFSQQLAADLGFSQEMIYKWLKASELTGLKEGTAVLSNFANLFRMIGQGKDNQLAAAGFQKLQDTIRGFYAGGDIQGALDAAAKTLEQSIDVKDDARQKLAGIIGGTQDATAVIETYKRAKASDLTLNADAIRQAEHFRDVSKNLNETWDKLYTSIIINFGPAATTLLQTLTNILTTGSKESNLEMFRGVGRQVGRGELTPDEAQRSYAFSDLAKGYFAKGRGALTAAEAQKAYDEGREEGAKAFRDGIHTQDNKVREETKKLLGESIKNFWEGIGGLPPGASPMSYSPGGGGSAATGGGGAGFQSGGGYQLISQSMAGSAAAPSLAMLASLRGGGAVSSAVSSAGGIQQVGYNPNRPQDRQTPNAPGDQTGQGSGGEKLGYGITDAPEGTEEGGTSTKGSWYSQHQGQYSWVDTADKPGSNALGVPDSQQGIALPSRRTLGQWFYVTAPNGHTYLVQQTDVGPGRGTGRGIDISAAAAERMGYTPKNFPTNGIFTYRPAAAPGNKLNAAVSSKTIKPDPGYTGPGQIVSGAGVTPEGAGGEGAGPNVPGGRVFPVTGHVTSLPSSARGGHTHGGLDIGAPVGTPVYASAGGTVIRAGPYGGYGNAIDVQLPDGSVERYGHLSRIFVQPGQKLTSGTHIGAVGSTGHSTGPHLHFEHRPAGTAAGGASRATVGTSSVFPNYKIGSQTTGNEPVDRIAAEQRRHQVKGAASVTVDVKEKDKSSEKTPTNDPKEKSGSGKQMQEAIDY
jgi:hypothetical protein